jgi:YesN/AraC family two-component response regulator
MEIPVIMATAKGTEFDKVKGLDMGADDYLVKPFGMMEMISRIKAVLRRTRDKARPSLVTFGDLTLEPQRYSLYHQGERVLLTLRSSNSYPCSCSIQTGSSPARNYWTRFGGLSFLVKPELWTFILAPCGPS